MEQKKIKQTKKQPKKQNKASGYFARTGNVLGTVALATFFVLGGYAGIPGIVFSKLGEKANDPADLKKSKSGLAKSIAGLVLSILETIGLIVFLIIYLINNPMPAPK